MLSDDVNQDCGHAKRSGGTNSQAQLPKSDRFKIQSGRATQVDIRKTLIYYII